MASIIPNDTKKAVLDAFIAGKTFTMSLHSSSYTPDKDNDTYFSDVDNEISGGGYTSGGQNLNNVTTAVDDTSDLAYITCDAEVFSSLTNTFRYLIIRDNTGVAATSRIVTVIDLGADRSPYAGDFTYTPAADGFLKLTE